MRQPFQLTDIGKSLKSADLFRYFPEAREGRFETTSQIDQIHRVFTFRQIGNFPIIVSLGAATSDIYAAWSIKAALMIGMVAIVCLITLMLTVVLAREFTKRRDAEEAVRQSERRFRLLSENSSDAVVLRNLAGEREYASSGFYKLIGYSPEEIAGRTFSEFIAPDCKDIPKASIEKVLAGSKHVVDSFRFCRGDGSWVWIETISSPFAEENGTITGVVSSLRDITQRKLAEEELESKAANLADIAMRDALTGLANRRGFDERLKEEWSRAERGGDPLSLLMIDVDLFKSFNDALGHVAGDEALRRVANCISTHMLRPGDFGARYGGEEFALILRNTGSRGAYHVAEVLRNAIEGLKIPHPKGLNGHVTISLGLATVPDLPGIDLVQFVKAADAALYEAKRLGRNRVERFERHTGASDNNQTSLAS